MYLTLVGYFSGQTGYPALRLSVSNADVLDRRPDRDLLVIGTTGDQRAITALNDVLPVSFDASGSHVTDVSGAYDKLRRAWWNLVDKSRAESGSLTLNGEVPDAILEGIESPYSKGRSIVVVGVKSQDEVQPFLNAFILAAQSSDIGKSVSILNGTKFESYRFSGGVYRVGDLGYWARLNLWFVQYPWLVIVLVILLCVLMAFFARTHLRRKARTRLMAREV